MRVKKVGVVPGDPYWELHLEVDGVPVALTSDQQKPTLTAVGLVYLGGPFEATLRPITFASEYGPLELRGFTDDPDVVRHFRDFLDQINR